MHSAQALLVLHCPTTEYLDSLLQSDHLRNLQRDRTHPHAYWRWANSALMQASVRLFRLASRSFVAALRWVVLSCPPAVLEDKRFVTWAAQLGLGVQCVVANEQCGQPTHLFPASAGVHVRLGALEPALFPPLQPETGAAQPVAGTILKTGAIWTPQEVKPLRGLSFVAGSFGRCSARRAPEPAPRGTPAPARQSPANQWDEPTGGWPRGGIFVAGYGGGACGGRSGAPRLCLGARAVACDTSKTVRAHRSMSALAKKGGATRPWRVWPSVTASSDPRVRRKCVSRSWAPVPPCRPSTATVRR